MTFEALLALILAFPVLRDGTPQHNPIPQPREAAEAIARAVVDSDANDPMIAPEFTPLEWAAVLNVWGALESGFNPRIAGDCPGMRPGARECTRERGARHCGAFALACSTTPPTMPWAEQARRALATMRHSARACPEFPMSLYASGRCMPIRVVEWRMTKVRAALLTVTP